mmetsp:Transcript_167648/g.538479  ORF Transcript_167648/g.538479 Transcript_167648/m.538479 type:complete len:214 (+) Transcript_167648:562-1203(+)
MRPLGEHWFQELQKNVSGGKRFRIAHVDKDANQRRCASFRSSHYHSRALNRVRFRDQASDQVADNRRVVAVEGNERHPGDPAQGVMDHRQVHAVLDKAFDIYTRRETLDERLVWQLVVRECDNLDGNWRDACLGHLPDTPWPLKDLPGAEHNESLRFRSHAVEQRVQVEQIVRVKENVARHLRRLNQGVLQQAGEGSSRSFVVTEKHPVALAP